MRKLSITIVLAVLVAGLCSCAKTEVSMASHSESIVNCSHIELEHHLAQSPTYEEFGSVEYWECRNCGSRFADPQASTPFTGYKYILPTRFVDMTDYLKPENSKSTVETVSAIVAVAGFAVTVGGLVTTCVSLTDATDDIADKIDELSEKEDKNAEDIQELQKLTDELVVKINELNVSLAETSENLNALVQQMNVTQKLMDSAEAMEDVILNLIMEAENEIESAKLLDARYQQIQGLKFSSICAFRSIENYMTQARTSLETATNQADSLEVFSDMRRNVVKVLSSWGSEKACYPSQTATMLAEFMGMTYDDNTSFLDLLSVEGADVLPFAHQIIIVKKLYAERELCILSLSNALSGCYYRHCCGKNNAYASHTADAMDKKLEQCFNLRETYYEKWDRESNVAPWHCNVTDRYLQSDIVYYSPKNFFSNNKLTMKNGKMVSSYYPISYFYNVSQEDAMIEQEYELMLKDFYLMNGRDAKTVKELLFSTDRPGMVFHDTCPQDYANSVHDVAFSIAYSSDEYVSMDGRDLYYTCYDNDFKFSKNLVEYSILKEPTTTNGENTCYYMGSNGRTRFYTVRATAN